MQDSGSLAVFKVTAGDQGHYKGPSGAFVTYCSISCFCLFFVWGRGYILIRFTKILNNLLIFLFPASLHTHTHTHTITHTHTHTHTNTAGPRRVVGSASDSKGRGPGFDSQSGHILSFLLPLIQEGQLLAKICA